MSNRYSKGFKQTSLDLFTQGKSARQLSLEYEVGYSALLKWVQVSKPTSPSGLTQDEVKALKKQIKEKDEESVILILVQNMNGYKLHTFSGKQKNVI